LASPRLSQRHCRLLKLLVALASFIEGVDPSKLEFAIAPPKQPIPINPDGEYRGIQELGFL
jgi:hypothetical protein